MKRRKMHVTRVAPCPGVRDHADVTLRPHTKMFPLEARERLGLAIQRAREAANYLSRPAFAKTLPIGLTSLVKLETGKPVGPTVYEAVARMLPNWTEDTPVSILEGGPIPAGAAESTSLQPRPTRPTRDELLMQYRRLEGVMEIVVDEQRRWREREEDVRRQLREIDDHLAEIYTPEQRKAQ